MVEKEHEKELEKLKKEIGEGFTDELDKKISSLKEGLWQLKENGPSVPKEEGSETKGEIRSKSFIGPDWSSEKGKVKSDLPDDKRIYPKSHLGEVENEKSITSQDSHKEAESLGNTSEQENRDVLQKQEINEGESQIKGKVDILESSIKHLDNAIQSLIKIIGNAKGEFNKSSGAEEKLDEIIRQNRAIISKLNQLPTDSPSKTKSEKKENASFSESSYGGKSPFMPKANLPHLDNGLKRNPAPRPPEEDNDTTIPYLKPRKKKN